MWWRGNLRTDDEDAGAILEGTSYSGFEELADGIEEPITACELAATLPEAEAPPQSSPSRQHPSGTQCHPSSQYPSFLLVSAVQIQSPRR